MVEKKRWGQKNQKEREGEEKNFREKKKVVQEKREFLCKEKFLRKKVCQREGRKGNQEKKRGK